MLRYYLLLHLTLATLIQVKGQQGCGFEEFREYLSNKNPTYQQNQSWRNMLQDTVSGTPIFPREKIRIPVVVHVVWYVAEENISEEQIESQLVILNRDFNRLNSDTSRTPAFFKPLAGKMDIEFCLARMDIDGNPTSGIIRRQTEIQEIGSSPYRVYYGYAGGSKNWDPYRYLNIWVCNIDNARKTFGIATTPEVLLEDDDVDGIVIDYRAFGNMGTATFPTDQGRTLTHEMGHYLGLMHTWSKQGCIADDLVEDTPIQLNGYVGCPGSAQYSCGSQDMFMNYMDVVHDTCMNLFTKGQVSRMMSTLLGPRNTLLNSGACEFTSVSDHNAYFDDPINFYPNPVSDVITMANLPFQSRKITFYSSLGLPLAVFPLNSKQESLQISVSHFLPGSYYCSIQTDKGPINIKWVKQ